MYRFSRFLSDYLLFSACCTFLISTLNPFLTSNYYFPSWGDLPVIRSFSVTYWSYKAFLSNGTEVFLKNYWFSNADPALVNHLGIYWILVAIFFLQILTLTSGIFSLLKARKARIIPFISSIIIVFLMIQIYLKTSGIDLGFKTYQLGYWLNYPSIFLYFYALIFHLYSNREKTYTPTHTLTQ